MSQSSIEFFTERNKFKTNSWAKINNVKNVDLSMAIYQSKYTVLTGKLTRTKDIDLSEGRWCVTTPLPSHDSSIDTLSIYYVILE